MLVRADVVLMGEVVHRLRSAQSGFTLIETIMVSMLSLLVVGIPLAIGSQAFSSHAETAALVTSSARAENGMRLLLSDLRGSYQSCVASGTPAPTVVTSTTLTLWIPVSGSSAATCTPQQQTQSVVWTCSADASCTRAVGGAAAVIAIPAVVSATFTPRSVAGIAGAPQTNPAHVDVSLQIRATDNDGTPINLSRTPTALSGGTDLRNFS